jgi:hypothetical protein
MKKPYCCNESRELYERYYDHQQNGKGDFPVYAGRYVQKGHGVGNIIGSLFRRILPTLKLIAPHILKTGANVLDDVSKGQSLKESVIKRVPESLSRITFGDATQPGSGKRKRRKINDIFD